MSKETSETAMAILKMSKDIVKAIDDNTYQVSCLYQGSYANTENGRVECLAGLMFNSGYMMDLIQDIRNTMKEIEEKL